MEEEFGQLNIQPGLHKTDPELIKKLFKRLKEETKDCKRPYTDESQVKTLMRFNIWTVDQFCDVSGIPVSTVNNMARPTFSAGKQEVVTKLNYCYPYPDSGGQGLKFIVRNSKSEAYIKL